MRAYCVPALCLFVQCPSPATAGSCAPAALTHLLLPVPVAVPEFCNGRQLRDYQKVSLQWMVSNWNAGTNCILGDEVGCC